MGRRFFRPTWAEVDLSLLRANLRRFKARLPAGVRLMFVVKGDAYGHGAVACAAAAQRARAADWFGVSSVEEGVVLREAGVRLPILILGSLYPFESFLAAAEYKLTPTVASLESAKRLAEVSRRLGREVACHLKIETGMGRIGVSPAAAVEVLDFFSRQRIVELSGVYTHLSCAETSRVFTRNQLIRFKRVLRRCPRGVIRHAANSGAALRTPVSRFDMVRPGLAIYGLYPGFDPILSLKTKVIFLKNVPLGTSIGYGARYRTRRPSRIATLPIGYADGIFRGLSGKGWALLGGRKCPIVAVTMDMIMIDAGCAPEARVGDHAVLIGSQGKERISASDIAKILHTIPYEITTAISSRVPRVYRS
ncbi:MAG: alanine racemase [Elusimicrobia bacterium RIFCSPHIGHO2_02_FULL_57_9]|nr:MAG: alanine racemase [Elusimicrobia bacterium RIFCSPHIGHO2_02_FULL_57_9]